MSAAALFAASMLAASAAMAQIAVQGDEATLRWTASSGPVSGYLVSVSRNGSSAQDEAIVYTNEVTLFGEPGEQIQVLVRAFNNPTGQPRVWGPTSEPSDPIRFEAQPLARDLYPFLDCASCRRFEIREPDGSVALAIPHPTPGSWDFLGTGVLEPGGNGHGLLRERATGVLMVSLFSGTGLVPIVSMGGFSTSTVSPPVDLDVDGIDEVLAYNVSNGRVTILGLEDGILVELGYFQIQPNWRWIGSGDIDGDGDLDAWFEATQGHVVVIHLRDFEAMTSTFISNSVSGTTPVDVADYDGDGRPDLLRRNNSTGALHVALMRGSRSAPTQEVRALATQSGDSNVVARGSWELDGTPGAEILLQNQSNGVIDIGHPVDPVPGRRERLANPGAGWRIVEVQ